MLTDHKYILSDHIRKVEKMIKLEVVRRLDKLGRICLPKDFRKSFNLNQSSEILITISDEGILLKKKESEDSLKTDTNLLKF